MNKLILSDSFAEFLRVSNNTLANKLYNYYIFSNDDDIKDSENYIEYLDLLELFTTENINYVTYRTNGYLSYLPNGKECIYNSDGDWARKNRVDGLPGRVIRKLLTDKGLERFNWLVESFAHVYTANFNTENLNFKLLKSDLIYDVYNFEVAIDESVLGESCMRDKGPEFFDLYRQDFVKILCLSDNDGILYGRAIIWDLSKTEYNMIIMDRIYYCKEHYCAMFFEYAKKNKWYTKVKQNRVDKTLFKHWNGEIIDKEIKFSIDANLDYYPYMDTFSYSTNLRSIQNYEPPINSGSYYIFDTTDGSYSYEEESLFEEDEENEENEEVRHEDAIS